MQRIFVGDVQGCSDELDELLARANSMYGSEFELWVAGDLVNRGPNNRRPLELVRRLIEDGRAQYVLGNHEINLISVALGLRDLGPNDSIGDILEAPDASEWVDWLRGRSLAVSGKIDDQSFVMLHASASPDWSHADLLQISGSVEQQLSASEAEALAFLSANPADDPVRSALGWITRCRSISAEGDWSSDEPETPPAAWHHQWAARGHDYGIVYGHWARQGLHVQDGLRGLDTGCVHHGRGRDGFLTAWVPDGQPRADGRRPFDSPDDRFWRVPAKKRYYNPVVDTNLVVDTNPAEGSDSAEGTDLAAPAVKR